MPPRKNPAHKTMEEDIEEIKNSMNFLTEEVTKIAKQQATIVDLMQEIKTLKNIVKERDKTIVEMERRLNDVEQYTRMEDVIISGLKVKQRSYARAAAEGRSEGEDAPLEDQQTLETQVIQFFASKDIEIDPNNLVACHTFLRKDRNVIPSIIIRFGNRKHKAELMKQGKKLRGSDVYINEHLTKKNAEIAREARLLRKQNKIKSTWTRNCKVLIKLNGDTPETAKVITVRDVKELDAYK